MRKTSLIEGARGVRLFLGLIITFALFVIVYAATATKEDRSANVTRPARYSAVRGFQSDSSTFVVFEHIDVFLWEDPAQEALKKYKKTKVSLSRMAGFLIQRQFGCLLRCIVVPCVTMLLSQQFFVSKIRQVSNKLASEQTSIRS